MSDKKIRLPKIKLPSLSADKKKQILAAVLALTATLAVVSVALSGLDALLEPVISEKFEDEVQSVFERIMPADSYEEIAFEFNPANKVEAAHTAIRDGKPSGYCVEIKTREGKVELHLVVGVSLEGKAVAVEIVELSEDMEYIKGDISTELLTVLQNKNESLAVEEAPKAPIQTEPSEAHELINGAVNSAASAISEYTKAKKAESAERAKEAIAAGVNASPSEAVIDIPEKEAYGAAVGAEIVSEEAAE